jgi:hypothetical protein
MSRFPDGDWVAIEDYEELKLKHWRLRDSIERITACLVEANDKCHMCAEDELCGLLCAIDDSLVISSEALKSEED